MKPRQLLDNAPPLAAAMDSISARLQSKENPTMAHVMRHLEGRCNPDMVRDLLALVAKWVEAFPENEKPPSR